MTDTLVIVVNPDTWDSIPNKRIKNELKVMMDKYERMVVSLDQEQKVSAVSLTRGGHTYECLISRHYPFHPPTTVLIDGQPEIEWLNKHTSNQLPNGRCICCTLYSCRDNWSASITMDNIVIQWEQLFMTFSETLLKPARKPD